MGVKVHNRWLYKKGCRCDVCRADAAAYERERYWADGHTPRKGSGELKHGTARGYRYHGCRCLACLNSVRIYKGLAPYKLDPRLPENKPVKVKIEKPMPIKITFPTPEERARRIVVWAGVTL